MPPMSFPSVPRHRGIEFGANVVNALRRRLVDHECECPRPGVVSQMAVVLPDARLHPINILHVPNPQLRIFDLMHEFHGTYHAIFEVCPSSLAAKIERKKLSSTFHHPRRRARKRHLKHVGVLMVPIARPVFHDWRVACAADASANRVGSWSTPIPVSGWIQQIGQHSTPQELIWSTSTSFAKLKQQRFRPRARLRGADTPFPPPRTADTP